MRPIDIAEKKTLLGAHIIGVDSLAQREYLRRAQHWTAYDLLPHRNLKFRYLESCSPKLSLTSKTVFRAIKSNPSMYLSVFILWVQRSTSFCTLDVIQTTSVTQINSKNLLDLLTKLSSIRKSRLAKLACNTEKRFLFFLHKPGRGSSTTSKCQISKQQKH